ncbi:hypothetical protein ACIHFB_01215 [Streptomyces sp. NPDC051963]|uniref:hypothetical protein n=1 Tax=Streptomyces sp. NPDC051963 TaxID=3365678 RepID=UPI0037D02BF8
MSPDQDQYQDGNVQELRRLLAVPTERDFPAGRRIQREEHLMRSWRTMADELTGGRRRRVQKRFALGLAAAAVAAGVTVAVPNGTQTPAYAVEANQDGTLTISIHELDWLGKPQQFDQLAHKIRSAGFTAIIDKVPAGRSCQRDRGELLEQEKSGDGKWDYSYTMTHADAFLVEEYLPGPLKGSDRQSAHFYRQKFIKGPVTPCSPVGHAQPDQPR